MPRVVPAGVLPKGALRYLRTKRRRPSGHWTDVWREEHAVAFTVAQMAQDAMLAEVHQGLLQALRKGETLETFEARLEPWLRRRGWAPKGRGGDIPTRLRRIYNTNLRTARAAGQWDRISRNADLLPYLIYELGPSEEHREEHAAWAGLCLKVDDPFWNTHYPPNGWGCKCQVRQVAAPPEGTRTKAPKVEYREWANPATGEARLVAVGIDPGWDYHIGARRTLGVNAALLRRCELAARTRGASVAARMVERHVEGPGFQWFVKRPRAGEKAYWQARLDLIEATPVGVLPPGVAAGMAASPVVRLTEKVMHKQAVHHPELPAEAYRRLPEILRASPVFDDGRWIFTRAVQLGGQRRSVRTVVEVSSAGDPLIVSVRRDRKG
ncbi:MAG: phage minor head protein [Acidobacteriota bacterium]|nr:phage minor head protein [Acidobacteriota bacterium]